MKIINTNIINCLFLKQILRSNGKIELDPKNKTIDNDDFDDSENIDNQI